MFLKINRVIAHSLAVAAVFGYAAGAARADVKVVTEVTLTGLAEMGAKGIPVKILHYYKGNMMREEWQGGTIIHIYDSKNDKYYTLNRSNETYSVQTLDDVLSSASGGLGSLDFEGAATVTDGGSTDKILGKPAKNYSILANLLLKAGQSGQKLLALKIQGEQWTTNAIPFAADNLKLQKAAFLLPTRVHKLFKPYYDKVGEMKGVPLSFDLILTFQAAQGAGISSGATGGTFEAHSDVQAISTASQPDYLFRIPKTYKLVARVDEPLTEK